MKDRTERRSGKRKARSMPGSRLTLLIAERASRLSCKRAVPPGGELALWLEAEAEVKRELERAKAAARTRAP